LRQYRGQQSREEGGKTTEQTGIGGYFVLQETDNEKDPKKPRKRGTPLAGRGEKKKI